ncbi:MAG TPA: phosphate ABC transporter substrate-binding/OmpA family protein [Candidatus Limnocylindrales bacterium]|nr:phosphate ABC transporter substrate-binding/OmpA family protein [Candidatus Limnocylindrales bacterium]
MASGVGRCINFGGCTKADTKEQIPMASPDAICPECGKPLIADSSRGSILIVVLGLGCLALVVVGAAFGIRSLLGRGSPSPGPVANATPASAAAPASPRAAAPSVALLRLCGSNTIGSQLGPELVKAYLLKNGATQVTQQELAADEHLVTATLNGGAVSVSVAAHGSATAFEGLRRGACDVGMASRGIKRQEMAHLASLGDMTSRASEHVIGLDGIAVIVNPSNPVDALTVDQLRNIYAGRVGNWKQVGGRASQISVEARDDKSGTYDTFSSLVLGKQKLVRGAKRFEDSRALSDTVSGQPNAIGFIGLPYVGNSKALKVASGGLAIAPNPLTVGRETYPLTRRLYLYTASNPSNAQVRRFIDFVQSPDGQRTVERAGFVATVVGETPVAVKNGSVPPGAPAEYARIVRSSDQLPFNFYFKTGSPALDNKAYVDVGRLVAIVSTKREAGRKVVLVGFADSTGTHDANRALSIARAESVKRELISQGVNVKEATGFGDALPIRDNATEDGRQKNRRVEIFLAR